MGGQGELVFDDVGTSEDVGKHAHGVKASGGVKKRQSGAKLGCDACPSKLNWKHGVKPIFGEVTGKRLFVWAQSPGMQENKKGVELIGPAGQFLWTEMKKVGLTRDMCDIQNVVRCVPVDYQQEIWPPLEMRSPEKEEIKCCSIYTQQAIEKSKAKVHLVFGAIAHKAVLGTEYKKARKVFYSSRLKGSVFLLDHPSFFLRSGFGGAGQNRVPSDRLKQFRRMLRDASEMIKHGNVGKYSYVMSQKYQPVESDEDVKKAAEEILAAKHRVAIDSEYGWIKGKHRHLCVAFILRPGYGWVFPTDMPGFDKEFLAYCKEVVGGLLSNPDVLKVFHHGNSDVEEAKEMLGITVKGYDYETEYAEYFVNPVEKAATYGLEAIGDRRFPKFGGWKEIILPEAFKDEWLEKKKLKRDRIPESKYMKLYDEAKKTNGLNYGLVPWKKLAIRCAADADITKRIEITTKEDVSKPLLDIYRDSAFVLGRMEHEGPLFDYQHVKVLRKWIPVKLDLLLREIRTVAKNPKLSPGSPKQLYDLLYNQLKLEWPFPVRPGERVKKNTQKPTLVALATQNPVCNTINEWRKLAKIKSTYMDGFEFSANANGGRLRTKWWLTGTRTGRLSSGGGAERKSGDRSITNLQNIHGDPQLQCLAISDPRWREVYRFWKQEGEFTEDNWQQFEDYYVFLGFDFAQMELRFIAEMSGDKEYAKMFMDPRNDPHSMVGHALTGWAIEKIKQDERIRRIVKALHFGIIYGLKAPGLVANLAAQGIKVTVEKMQHYIDLYFEKFRGVRRWLDNQVKLVERLGYAETVFGMQQKINVEEQKYLGREWEGSFWGNQAVNFPIQGGAHQMMLLSVAALQRKPEQFNLLQHPQLEVHDALYLRVKLKLLWKALKQGINLLEVEPLRVCKDEFRIDWHIPLKAEGAAGFRFGVKVKGIEEGEWTTAKFLNKWAEKNRELQIKLKKELAAVA